MPNVDLVNRYDRQRLIDGWDQEKIEEGVVTIVGSEELARYTALPLAALGVGTIRLVDTASGEEDDMLLDVSLNGNIRTQKLEDILRKVNPNINVFGINSELSSAPSQYFLEGSDVVIDATNRITSKSYAVDFCYKKGIPFISASANEKRGKAVFSIFGKQGPEGVELMPMFNGAKQGSLVSLVLGGVITEEVKKALFGEKSEKLYGGTYDYNLESNNRFSHRSDMEISSSKEDFKDLNLLMVGAGALGCFLGLAIVENLSPRRLDIMDFDIVEDHNLNRQICYYNSIGKPKATALSKVLRSISKGKSKIGYINDRFAEDFKPEIEYDLILDAVDSFQAKYIVHNFAMRSEIPLVSGGTDYRAATVLAYVPRKTSCFNCQINLDQLAMRAEIVRRTSCLQSPDPSVIMTNQIAGGIMAAEARRVLRPEVYGEPINGEIKYISNFNSRGGVSNKPYICDCHKNEIRSLELPNPERVKIEEREDNGRVWQEVYVDGRRI